jgi:hypothetical protein
MEDLSRPQHPRQRRAAISIYSEVKASGGYISNHASDLYIEVNDENTALIVKHGGKSITVFRNRVTGKMCYDIPFAFDPYWEATQAGAVRRAAPATPPEVPAP